MSKINKMIEKELIASFKEYAFRVEASMRDSFFDGTTKKNIKCLWNILGDMEEFYRERFVVSSECIYDFINCPMQIYACRYNIIAKKQQIEDVANTFWDYQKKIMASTFQFVAEERDPIILDERYEKILQLEEECWNCSCGKKGFISTWQATQKLDYEQIDIFIGIINKIVNLSMELQYYTKNTVRILCNVKKWYYDCIDKRIPNDEERIYLNQIYRSI